MPKQRDVSLPTHSSPRQSGSHGNRAGRWPRWRGNSGFRTMCCIAGGPSSDRWNPRAARARRCAPRQEELTRLKRENETLRKERDFLKRAAAFFARESHEIPRDPGARPSRIRSGCMCRALAVSAAGYYAWRTRPESTRSANTRTLLSAIRVIHQESRETYGSPSIWDALLKQGHGVGEHRVARLMRQRRHPCQDREEVACHHPVPSSVPRGREHPQSPVHGRRLRIGCGPGTSPTCGPQRAGSIWRWSSTSTRAP